MNKLKFIFYICITCIAINISGQGQLIRGIILEKSTGEPLPGVNIVELNQNGRIVHGTISDFSGEFIIIMETNATSLQISFIGYKTKDVDIVGKDYIKVLIEEETTKIDEVTVTAERIQTNSFMPVSVRKATSSISTIDFRDVEELGVTSVTDALAGQISGLDISLASGDPGASASIQIRGASSINGRNEPLIVIDGIPYDTDVDDDFEFASATTADYGALVDIAPEDISNIEIYKDAAATAAWGSKAANGVLAITTKRGKKGPTVFSYSYKLTRKDAPDPIPLLDGPGYTLMQLDAQYNISIDKTGLPPNFLGDDYLPLQYDPSYEYYYEHSQNTDWVGAITQTGFKGDHNFSMSGGGDKANYRISIGYLDETGTTVGTALQRLTTRINLEYLLSNSLRFYTNFSLANSNQYLNYDMGVDKPSVREMAYRKAPNMAIYEMLGPDSASTKYFSAYYDELNEYLNQDIQNYQGKGDEWWNPVAMAREGKNHLTVNRIKSDIGFKYDIIPQKLTLNTYIAYDIDNKERRTFLPQVATGVLELDEDYNKAEHYDNEHYIINHTSKLFFKHNINNVHDFIIVSAYELNTKNGHNYLGSSQRSPSSSIKNHTSEGPIENLESKIKIDRNVGFIFNTRYAYKEMLVFEPGFRYDGNSRFGEGNKWGFFPFVSTGWFISQLPFLQNKPWIDDIKLRYSLGIVGRSPEYTLDAYGLYSESDGYLNIGGIRPKNIQLYNLRWEKITKYNYGADIYLFNNRLTLKFDKYNNITTDVLHENYRITSTTGFNQLKWYNGGKVQNGGIETEIDFLLLKQKNINFSVQFNFSKNTNVINSMPKNIEEKEVDMLSNGNYTRSSVFGGGVHAYYGYVYDGVYAFDEDAYARDSDGELIKDQNGTPLKMRFGDPGGYVFRAGDARYLDINYDGLINELDVVQLGSPYPDFHGGFGFRLKLFNQLSVNSFFQYKVGHDIVNKAKMDLEKMYDENNQAISTLRRWRQPGDSTDIPRALYDAGYNWLGSSRFVEDASFLKLRSISVSYTIPDKWQKAIKMKDLKCYFTIYNLYTWTNYTGQNPEVNVSSKDPFYIGLDNNQTPPPRDFVFGFNVKF